MAGYVRIVPMATFSTRGRSRLWAYVGVLVLAGVAAAAALYAVQSVSAQGAGSGVTPPSAVSPDPALTTIAFLGDDPAASAPSGSGDVWPERVAADVDAALVDLSAAGAGFATGADVSPCEADFCPSVLDAVPDAVAADADIVIVSAGTADASVSRSELRSRAVAVFNALRVGLPSAQIVVVGPVSADPATPEVTTIEGILKAAASQADVRYVSLLSPAAVTADDLDDDGSLTGDGQQAVAERVVRALGG